MGEASSVCLVDALHICRLGDDEGDYADGDDGYADDTSDGVGDPDGDPDGDDEYDDDCSDDV